MNGIEIRAGVNNCYWNLKGLCTNYKVTRNKIESVYRDWKSRVNCTMTIYGVYLCSEYKPEKLWEVTRGTK